MDAKSPPLIPFDVRETRPLYMTPRRKELYLRCRECGEMSWDVDCECCMAEGCGTAKRIDWDTPTPQEVVERIDFIQEHMMRRHAKCEVCDNYAVVVLVYEMRMDYTGKLVGWMNAERCVPCAQEDLANPEGGYGEGYPVALEYIDCEAARDTHKASLRALDEIRDLYS